MSDEKIIIDPRFCGPPDVGNGGYVAGLLAARLEGTVEVRLRAPAALDHPLVVRATDGGVELLDGGQCVATARCTVLDLDVPAPPAFAEAQERAGSCRAFQTHPFPRCFVCGPDRAPGDGLRILPCWFPERELAAAPWQPDRSLADSGGRVPAEFIWAALDSPSSFPLLEDPEAQKLEPMVLGSLTVRRDREVRAGERCVVSTWSLGLEGRRGTAGAALTNEAGELCAVARAVWVSIARSE